MIGHRITRPKVQNAAFGFFFRPFREQLCLCLIIVSLNNYVKKKRSFGPFVPWFRWNTQIMNGPLGLSLGHWTFAAWNVGIGDYTRCMLCITNLCIIYCNNFHRELLQGKRKGGAGTNNLDTSTPVSSAKGRRTTEGISEMTKSFLSSFQADMDEVSWVKSADWSYFDFYAVRSSRKPASGREGIVDDWIPGKFSNGTLETRVSENGKHKVSKRRKKD